MSAFTLVYTRAAGVFPSNTVNIPFPNMVMDGTNTSAVTNQLVDNTVDFIARGIKIGDIIKGVIGASIDYTTVIGVNATSLLLSSDIFTTAGLDYFIYQGPNYGCYLYVGGTGSVSVQTIGGDSASFVGVPAGTILPVQVLRVNSTGTTATSIVALW
jgi:hypothetical protein